jgi:hypothetical protein
MSSVGQGIKLHLARTWDEDRNFEMKLRRGNDKPHLIQIRAVGATGSLGNDVSPARAAIDEPGSVHIGRGRWKARDLSAIDPTGATRDERTGREFYPILENEGGPMSQTVNRIEPPKCPQ